MWKGGADHSWVKMALIRPGTLKASVLAFMAVLLGMILICPQAVQAASTASWQVGRAAVQKGVPPVLKLSLRNDGPPSKEGVRVLGRWGHGAAGKRGFSAGELASMSELGTFTGEVALQKTAIIEVPLSSLGAPHAGNTAVEIAVMTGGELTDGLAIHY